MFPKTFPNFDIFHKDLCQYFLSHRFMKEKNAIYLCSLIDDLKRTENP